MVNVLLPSTHLLLLKHKASLKNHTLAKFFFLVDEMNFSWLIKFWAILKFSNYKSREHMICVFLSESALHKRQNYFQEICVGKRIWHRMWSFDDIFRFNENLHQFSKNFSSNHSTTESVRSAWFQRKSNTFQIILFGFRKKRRRRDQIRDYDVELWVRYCVRV